MKTMTNAEALAAIDRGMKRVWAKFPLSGEPPAEAADGSGATRSAGVPGPDDSSREDAKTRTEGRA